MPLRHMNRSISFPSPSQTWQSVLPRRMLLQKGVFFAQILSYKGPFLWREISSRQMFGARGLRQGIVFIFLWLVQQVRYLWGSVMQVSGYCCQCYCYCQCWFYYEDQDQLFYGCYSYLYSSAAFILSKLINIIFFDQTIIIHRKQKITVHPIQMISLQIQLKSLKPASPTLPHPQPQQQITLQLGPLHTELILDSGLSCGKSLLLDMTAGEVEDLFGRYAFGLFMENTGGRFWCLMSLEEIGVGDCVDCGNVVFYNDGRQVCYTFDLAVKLTEFHLRLPKAKQPLAPTLSLTSPPQPQQQKTSITSFLHGNKQAPPPPTRGAAQARQKARTKTPVNVNANANVKGPSMAERKVKITVLEPDEESEFYIPPVMEFVNAPQEPDHRPIIHPQDNLPTVPNFNKADSNPNEITQPQSKHPPKLQTFHNYSEFKQRNQPQPQPQPQSQSQAAQKQHLRDLARKEAEQEMARRSNQIMIPIPNPRTGTYELVPLSKMSQAEIVQYARKQKMAEEFQEWRAKERERMERKERRRLRKREIVGKMKKQARNELSNQGIGQKYTQKQKISQKNEQSISSSSSNSSNSQPQQTPPKIQPKPKPKPQEEAPQTSSQNQNQNDENYESDFESISNAGSQLKSRLSLQSSMSMSQGRERKKPQESELNQSMNDYQYSQDFDSFSQSLLSKNKKASSISEISGSFASVSYRKP